jgi:hypothetical protein
MRRLGSSAALQLATRLPIVSLIFKKCNLDAISWMLPQYQSIDFTKDYWQRVANCSAFGRKRSKDACASTFIVIPP